MRAVLLGASSALATALSDNTYLVLDLPSGPLLVDCGGAPAHQLLRLGLDPLRLQAILLTHGHADHVYGLPSLLQHVWLLDHGAPIPVLGNQDAIRVARVLIEAASPLSAGTPRWGTVPERASHRAWEGDGLTLRTFPVRHSRPCLGLRIGDLAYSSDTQPSPNVVQAARGARTLVHEATVLEPSEGHSTLEDAARAAAEAEVEELVAVHLHERWQEDPPAARALVAKHFGGGFRVGTPGMEIALEVGS